MPTDFAPGPTATTAAPLFAGVALLDAEKLGRRGLNANKTSPYPTARAGRCSPARVMRICSSSG